MKIQIGLNDQGREFVNKVSAELHRLIGTQQHITRAYHPQAHGLVERQNRTIKGSFKKSLKDRSNWVGCPPAVLLFCISNIKTFFNQNDSIPNCLQQASCHQNAQVSLRSPNHSSG